MPSVPDHEIPRPAGSGSTTTNSGSRPTSRFAQVVKGSESHRRGPRGPIRSSRRNSDDGQLNLMANEQRIARSRGESFSWARFPGVTRTARGAVQGWAYPSRFVGTHPEGPVGVQAAFRPRRRDLRPGSVAPAPPVLLGVGNGTDEGLARVHCRYVGLMDGDTGESRWYRVGTSGPPWLARTHLAS